MDNTRAKFCRRYFHAKQAFIDEQTSDESRYAHPSFFLSACFAHHGSISIQKKRQHDTGFFISIQVTKVLHLEKGQTTYV
jgi:hypothetical protein